MKTDETKLDSEVQGETVGTTDLHEKAAIGLVVPALLLTIIGVIGIWDMFTKADGYDGGGFDMATFLACLGVLATGGLLALAFWGLLKNWRWAVVLGLALCTLSLLFGMMMGFRWVFVGVQPLKLDPDEKVQLLVLILVLTVGATVEAVWLVRILTRRG